MKNFSQFNKVSYSYEIFIPSNSPSLPKPACGVQCIGRDYATIKECVEACKAACAECGIDYNDHEVKLFMTDSDGVWEVTEEGELAN